MRYLSSFHLIQIYLILSMVAEVVVCTGGGDSSQGSNSNSNAMALIKVLSTATKLTDTNYTAWYAGLVTVLLGFTGDPFDKLNKTLEKLRDQLTNSVEALHRILIQEVLKSEYEAAVKGSTTPSPMAFVTEHGINNNLYQTIVLTISDTCEAMVAIKNHLSTSCMKKGIEALKYIHDNVGPGSGSMQIGRTIDIMSEKQRPDELPEAFGTRLNNLNSSLTEKVGDNILKQLFIRGLTDDKVKGFVIRELCSNPTMTYLSLTGKAKEFAVQEHIGNGQHVDGLNARVRRNGGRNDANDGNRNQGGFQGKCRFCDRPGHMWRQCFLLLAAKRPQNANHERLPSGTTVPLSLDGNVTRCKTIQLGRQNGGSATHGMQQRTASRSTAKVPAQASAVVDATRGAPADQRAGKLFASWTRKACGLAPRALSHLSGATVGCPCRS